jgi:hypothetical protein
MTKGKASAAFPFAVPGFIPRCRTQKGTSLQTTSLMDGIREVMANNGGGM